MKLLVFVTDAFGGRGGIAKFNRDLLTALCLHPRVEEVRALPRVIPEDPGALPNALRYETAAARGKTEYLYHTARLLKGPSDFSGVICGHLRLLLPAVVAARRYGVPLILIVHGIEAWRPPRIPGIRRCLDAVAAFVSVSRLTKQRFLEWAPLREEQGYIIPNCIDSAKFAPGPKPDYLLRRYGLSGRVIMTLARLNSSERYKGIDEIVQLMPSLVQEIPDLVYLIAGDGDDRPRLQTKVNKLRMGQHVVFAGYIQEEEKADHFRVADAFVMPGRGEGFGIVYLEAMACGIPVVASTADASREAVLDGQLGLLANPDSPEEILSAIKEALNRIPCLQQQLEYFSFERFAERWHDIVHDTFPKLGSFQALSSPFGSSRSE
jgi:phosphatidyl-myo-inositol dimannoside synthase